MSGCWYCDYPGFRDPVCIVCGRIPAPVRAPVTVKQAIEDVMCHIAMAQVRLASLNQAAQRPGGTMGPLRECQAVITGMQRALKIIKGEEVTPL